LPSPPSFADPPRRGPPVARSPIVLLPGRASPMSLLPTRTPAPAAAPARRKRGAAAAVEFALVAPVLLLFVLGIIEFGRLMMVEQILTNAAREGARRAVMANATQSDVSS